MTARILQWPTDHPTLWHAVRCNLVSSFRKSLPQAEGYPVNLDTWNRYTIGPITHGHEPLAGIGQ